MILTVEIGNTSISFGAFNDGKMMFKNKFAALREKSSDEYAAMISEMFRMKNVDVSDIKGAVMLSVVPAVSHSIASALQGLNIRFFEVGAGIKTGINIKTDSPGIVGADIVANSVGALERFKPPLVIADYGTATTLTVINQKRELCGCIIAPGVKLSADALSAKCALLPDIALQTPSKLLGTNTADSINSGCVYSSAMVTDSFVNKIRKDYGFGEELEIVATGGLASLVVPLCENKIHLLPDLTLQGLYNIYNLNKKRFSR